MAETEPTVGASAVGDETVIEVRNLVTHYGERKILDDVDMDIRRGEIMVIMGGSGSGKSTLLSLICGTLQPDSGTIEVSGADMASLSGARRDRLRAEQIGVIFQQFNLLPFATVSDNILLPLRFAPAAC